jgi:hypothetical protein
VLRKDGKQNSKDPYISHAMVDRSNNVDILLYPEWSLVIALLFNTKLNSKETFATYARTHANKCLLQKIFI